MSPLTSSAKKSGLHFAGAFMLLIGLLIALGRDHGSLPALGPLLNPFHGLWEHRLGFWDKPGAKGDLKVAGLKSAVRIEVDREGVKHVFAENDDDLYLAQGYLVASERLWEMEFLARIAAGRLSEVLGEKTLEFDRYFTKLGLPQAGRESAELMAKDPVTSGPLKAYAAGVNAYMATLDPAAYPFEYKLLKLSPEAWTVEKAAYLLKYMAYDLTGHNRELALTRSRARVSKGDFDSLFPLAQKIPEPIVPRGTNFNFSASAPKGPETEFLADLKALDPLPQPHPSNGSNNWAVSARKSATGRPLVSNDVHLSYALPALWYEIQLVSPTQNVYGATIPGAPGVIIGFNENVAWAVTNAGADVLDWYQLRFRDEHRSEYLFEGSWRPVVSREVKIQVRGGPTESLFLRQTHLGPIVYDQSETPVVSWVPRGLAMRWAALDPSNELKSFLLLNRAKTFAQCREALESFQTPAQNFLCASHLGGKGGDIGLWHMGRFPARWPGQGRMISDGSSRLYEWKGWLPRTEVPASKNPARGFLSSANQAPADESYPHYLGWPFASPFRAIRINEVLREKKILSGQDLVALQGDTLSVLARAATPLLLKAIEDETFDDQEKSALEALRSWNFRYDSESAPAVLFEQWVRAFEENLWRPHFPDRASYAFPPFARTLELMQTEPRSKWFDDPQTPVTETFHDVALRSFREGLKAGEVRFGRYSPEKWKWKKHQRTEFPHISKIPGLGNDSTVAAGVAESVFANEGRHGPVWKMVVELGPRPKAWSIYPGGQSGDPVSPHYDDFLERWSRNEFKEVVFLKRGEKSEKSAWFKPGDENRKGAREP